MTPERIDDESLDTIIDMRRRTIERYKKEGNLGKRTLSEFILAALVELQKNRHDKKAFNGTVTTQTAEALKLSGEELKALQGRVEGELKPFMYGIADPDGAAHFGEFCVSSDAAHVEDEVHQLNEQCTEDGEPLYKVVPLYRLPNLEGAK